MNATIIRSNERGKADFGWLQARYSFSFANYYNPAQIHFGKLRVLNDDTIAANRGFATHPHANMEIITIPLKGALEHQDSTGARGVIRPGEVQVMSAGTGIEHSEKNAITDGETKLFQIWIFPEEQDIEPNYQQQSFNAQMRLNRWQPIVSNKHQGALSINQDAVLSLAELNSNQELEYHLNYDQNGVYLMVIDGKVEIEENSLGSRDAIALTSFKSFKINALENSKLLAIEVPLN